MDFLDLSACCRSCFLSDFRLRSCLCFLLDLYYRDVDDGVLLQTIFPEPGIGIVDFFQTYIISLADRVHGLPFLHDVAVVYLAVYFDLVVGYLDRWCHIVLRRRIYSGSCKYYNCEYDPYCLYGKSVHVLNMIYSPSVNSNSLWANVFHDNLSFSDLMHLMQSSSI